MFVSGINAEPEALRELGLKAIKLTHNLQYDEANKIFDEMIRMEPENAMGYFFKSACYYWMEDYSLSSGKGYRDISFKAADMAKSMLDKNKDDIDACSTWAAYTGNWDYIMANMATILKLYGMAAEG